MFSWRIMLSCSWFYRYTFCISLCCAYIHILYVYVLFMYLLYIYIIFILWPVNFLFDPLKHSSCFLYFSG